MKTQNGKGINTQNVDGTKVSGLYDKGIITEKGKKIPIPGYDNKTATIFYLVRHAEKGSGNDPELTREGTARAKKLGNILKSTRLNKVYSTNTKRTINTAAPTAELQKTEVDNYEYQVQGQLIKDLKNSKGKKFLIVGHSNSIPDILNLFQGKKVYDDIDESIYDNFYIIVVTAKGTSEIIALKY